MGVCVLGNAQEIVYLVFQLFQQQRQCMETAAFDSDCRSNITPKPNTDPWIHSIHILN